MRDWSKISPNSILGKALRLPFKLIPKRAVVSVRAGLNRGMRWIVGTSIHGCWLGTYEFDKQETIKQFVKPGMKVLDIGANAGFYTLAFSRLVGEQGHVWAFEPLAENADNILRHVALNRLQNVTLLQTAVTNRNGMIGFQIAGNNSMGFISDSNVTYKVPTVSLDHLFADEVIPLPDVIKIDVEGAEALVLEGAKNLLTLRKVVLFIALHGEKQKQLCQEILRSIHYDIFYLDGTKIKGTLLESDEIIATPQHSDPQLTSGNCFQIGIPCSES